MTLATARLMERRIPLLFVLLTLSLVWSTAAFAQVNVTATVGTPSASYATLKLAFDAINAGTQGGVVTVDITASTTEGTTPATLNSSGAGSASYTSVLIRPTSDGVSVSGNPVTGFGVIQLNGADNVTIDGDNPNTSGTNRDLTVNNTTTATVIANSAIRIATSATVPYNTNDGNTIKNCILNGNVTGGNISSITGTSTSSNSSFGIIVGPNGGATVTAITSVTGAMASGVTVNGLLIDNNAVNQCARGIVFLGASSSSSTGITISNNVVGAAGTLSGAPPYTSPSTTVYTKGIYVAGTNAVSITGNTVRNILSYVGTTMNAIELNTGIGTGTIALNNNTVSGVVNNGTGSGAGGIAASSASGTAFSISGNTVTSIQCVGSVAVAGMTAATSVTGGMIDKNKVTTVYSRGTATYGAYGINVTSGSNLTIQNNFVSDIHHDMTGGGAFSTTYGVFGLRIAGGTGHKVYHNSVNLFGADPGTAASSLLSAALAIVGTGQTGIDMRNNLLANTISSGTTSVAHVSLFLPSAGTSAMGLTLNNNAYFSGTDTARQGIGQAGTTAGTSFYLASNFDPSSTTPAINMRAYTSTLSVAGTNDNASFASTLAAPFTSTTDLHIPAGTATRLESSGAAGTGVAVDIDNETRPGPPGSVYGGGTANDIGADEFDGTPLLSNDMAALAFVDPTNGGSKLAGTSFGPQASFQNLGLAAQTSIPVRYRVVGPSPSTSEVYNQTGTIASLASGASTTVTFTSASFSAGTYTIYAKAENPGDGNSANDEITGTFEAVAPLCGTYLVGASQPAPFNTLTGAVGRLNAVGISCAVVFELTDATYTSPAETFPITINAFAGGGTALVTIRPASGQTPTISGSVASGALIKLNGADYVTIDGSNSGGTDRSLTITNSATTAPCAIWIASLGNGAGATNDTVKNCNINTSAATSATAYGISVSGATIGSAGGDNDDVTLQNNAINSSNIGIYANGNAAVSAGGMDNLVVTGNAFTGSSTAIAHVRRGGRQRLERLREGEHVQPDHFGQHSAGGHLARTERVKFVGDRQPDHGGGNHRHGRLRRPRHHGGHGHRVEHHHHRQQLRGGGERLELQLLRQLLVHGNRRSA